MARGLRPDERESQKRSVEHLQGLYSVVVALALSLAADRLLPGSDRVARARGFELAAALVVTLIPFYHGALRHLDDVYGPGSGSAAHSFSVLIDFLLLFVESCAFLALSVSIKQPWTFAWLFLALLALDVLWAYLTTTFLAARPQQAAPTTWLKVNLGFGLTLLAILVSLSVGGWGSPGVVAYVALLLATARTAVDYALSWKFYAAVSA
jgi:hypothetical protein